MQCSQHRIQLRHIYNVERKLAAIREIARLKLLSRLAGTVAALGVP